MVRQTRRTRAKSNKRGGRFMFKGQYGCTFRPAIKCQGNTERSAGKISKLMDRNWAEDEFRIHRLITPLDPDEKYFIVPSRMCKPEITDNAENDYASCKTVDINNKYITPTLLLTTDGGTDLHNLYVPTADLPAFLKSFLSLFEGLNLLHTHGVVHNDIKPANIVSLRLDDGTYKTRLIDFGLASTFRDFRSSSETYTYWSFEIRIVTNIDFYLKGDKSIIQNEIDEFYAKQKYGGRSFPYWLLLDDKGGKAITVDFVRVCAEMLAEKITEPKFFIVLSEIFALGRTLAEAYAKNTGHYYAGPGKVLFDGPNNPYQVKLRDTFSIPFYALIGRMLSPNLFERPLASECIREYTKILGGLT